MSSSVVRPLVQKKTRSCRLVSALFGVFLLVFATPAFADYPDTSWLVLPNAGFTPELGFILGVSGQYVSIPAEGAPADSVTFSGIYGTTGTFSLAALATNHLLDSLLLLETGTRLSYSPEEFFGLGRSPEFSESPEPYDALGFGLGGSALFRVGEQVRVGPVIDVVFSDIHARKNGGALDSGLTNGREIRGADGSLSIAVGPRVRFDSKDNAIFPSSGVYADSATTFVTTLSNGVFMTTGLDLRGFISTFEDTVFAGQVTVDQIIGPDSIGEPPFVLLPTFGGSNRVRGVEAGRFRDNTAVTAQIELRSPRVWRLRAVAFLGAGTVAEGPSDIGGAAAVVAGGGGIRFAVSADGDQHLRLDIAWDGENISPYISFGEAF